MWIFPAISSVLLLVGLPVALYLLRDKPAAVTVGATADPTVGSLAEMVAALRKQAEDVGADPNVITAIDTLIAPVLFRKKTGAK